MLKILNYEMQINNKLNIIITGSSGFIGKNLVNSLLETKLNILTLSKKNKINNYNKHLFIDLNNFEKFKKRIINFKPDVLIHLAWQDIPEYSFEVQLLNLKMSTNFLNFIINKTNCKKIIVSGSCWEYGKNQGSCVEGFDQLIDSYFSWSKKSLYNFINYSCEKKSISLIWLRIFYVYGPGQKKFSLIPSLTDSILKKKKIIIKFPYNRNDYIYIDDLINAFKFIIYNKIKTGIYNIGSGKSHSVLEIAKIIGYKITGKKTLSKKFFNKKINNKKINFWANTKKSKKIFQGIKLTPIDKGIEKYLENI